MTRINVLVGWPASGGPNSRQKWLMVNGWRRPWYVALIANGVPVVSRRLIHWRRLSDHRSISSKGYSLCASRKDDTDTQLALSIALTEFNADQVVLWVTAVGCTHFLLISLCPWNRLSRLDLRDARSAIRFLLSPGTYQLQKKPINGIWPLCH